MTNVTNMTLQKIQKKKKIIVEKVSISQAIRKNSGKIQVTGTITGLATLSKMISKAQLYCDKCGSILNVVLIQYLS